MARGRKNLKKRGPKVRRKQKNHSRFIKGTHTDEYVKVRRALAISADCRALLRLVACCVLRVACCVLCVACCVLRVCWRQWACAARHACAMVAARGCSVGCRAPGGMV